MRKDEKSEIDVYQHIACNEISWTLSQSKVRSFLPRDHPKFESQELCDACYVDLHHTDDKLQTCFGNPEVLPSPKEASHQI